MGRSEGSEGLPHTRIHFLLKIFMEDDDLTDYIVLQEGSLLVTEISRVYDFPPVTPYKFLVLTNTVIKRSYYGQN